MQLLTSVLPSTHNLLLVSDTHKGSLAHHRKGWDAIRKRVADEPDTWIALGGDLQEAILVDDKRFSHHVHDAKRTPIRIKNELIEDLMPIRHKILFALAGNHEMHLHRYGDLAEELCTALGIPYGMWTTKLAVTHKGKSKRLQYKLLYTHGKLRVSSSADDPVRRVSNMKLAIKRKLQPLAGDCAIMACGHAHQLLHIDPEFELYLTDDGEQVHAHYTKGIQTGGYIDPNLRWYACTGSLLKSFVTGAMTYSEMAMYAPNQLGYTEIQVRDGIIKKLKDVHVGHDDYLPEEIENDPSQEVPPKEA